MRNIRIFSFAIIIMAFSLFACQCSSTPQETSCQPKYVYDTTIDKGTAILVIDRQSYHNQTSSPSEWTPEAKVSKKVSISASVTTVDRSLLEVKGEQITGTLQPTGFTLTDVQAKAIHEHVSTINIAVTMEQEVTVGTRATLTIPPMSWGYTVFGVLVQIASGDLHSDNCPQKEKNENLTTFSPIGEKSCSWTRGPNVFEDGGQSPQDCPAIIAR